MAFRGQKFPDSAWGGLSTSAFFRSGRDCFTESGVKNKPTRRIIGGIIGHAKRDNPKRAAKVRQFPISKKRGIPDGFSRFRAVGDVCEKGNSRRINNLASGVAKTRAAASSSWGGKIGRSFAKGRTICSASDGTRKAGGKAIANSLADAPCLIMRSSTHLRMWLGETKASAMTLTQPEPNMANSGRQPIRGDVQKITHLRQVRNIDGSFGGAAGGRAPFPYPMFLRVEWAKNCEGRKKPYNS